jgi:hypothetical protein
LEKVVIMSIRKSIRKNIQILEEQKRIILTEEKIVKGRMSVLPKNVNRNSSIQVTRTFNSLFTEVRKLKSIGISEKIINENLISVLSQMFDNEGPKFIETVKTKLTDYLKMKLNLTDMESDILERAIGNTEVDDVSELFSDPKFLAQKISQAYSEDLSNMYTMLDDRGRKDVIKSIENSLMQKLEPLMGNVNSNMELKLKDIRDNIIS